MANIIFENQIPVLLAELSKKYALIAPVNTHPHSTASKINFKLWEEGDELALSYATTILPPKEFLLPPKEVLFEYDGDKIKKPKYEKTIIFGVSFEDLEGITKLEKIMEKPTRDEAFLKRRENTFVVAADRLSPPAGGKFDLYLQKISHDAYAAFAGTKFGSELLKNKTFKTQSIRVPKVKPVGDELLARPDLADIVAHSKAHPVWQELAEICFGCGICSYTCPLCYCFNTEDQITLPASKNCGNRCRNWDSCMNQDFAAISNHNFRPELADRIYNWYYHKFVRMPREYKFNGCVDCNRCVVFCPAKINYRNTLNRLVTDWETKGKK